jgi:hypothetical protein
MSSKSFIAPRLPVAPTEYDQQFMEQFMSVLRLYFNQLDNASPALLSSQNIGGTNVVSGLTFAQPDPANPGQQKISLPTDADFANLRSGDLFYDTSGGTATSYPIYIKA